MRVERLESSIIYRKIFENMDPSLSNHIMEGDILRKMSSSEISVTTNWIQNKNYARPFRTVLDPPTERIVVATTQHNLPTVVHSIRIKTDPIQK